MNKERLIVCKQTYISENSGMTMFVKGNIYRIFHSGNTNCLVINEGGFLVGFNIVYDGTFRSNVRRLGDYFYDLSEIEFTDLILLL